MFRHDFQTRPSRKRSPQSGYMLMVLLFVMTGLIIAAVAMAPAIGQQIHRDKEQEMIHRGAQYARAIKKYYKKFGRYPPTLEALEDTNHLRFLRKRYKDPFTQDGKWALVRYGQVQFNATQRQGGTGGFSGATGLPNVPGVTGLITGQNPQSSPMGTGLTGLSSSGGGSTTSTSGTGSSSTTTLGGTAGSTSAATSGTSGSTTTDTTGSSSSSFGQSTTTGGNQPFGGGAIIGVASLSEKESLRIVDDKNHYKDWKFIYDPTFDVGLINSPYDPKRKIGQFPNASQPGQQLGQPIGQQPGTGFGSSPSNSSSQSSQNPMGQPYHPPDQPAPNPQ